MRAPRKIVASYEINHSIGEVVKCDKFDIIIIVIGFVIEAARRLREVVVCFLGHQRRIDERRILHRFHRQGIQNRPLIATALLLRKRIVTQVELPERALFRSIIVLFSILFRHHLKALGELAKVLQI